MDKQLDKQFEKLESLKWNPFVGDEYLKIADNQKLLVVGESHYCDETKESIEKHENPDFTRIVVDEMGINRNYGNTKIFQNFHRALFENDTFDSVSFWNLASFYNFIQRPMTTNKSRPTKDDIREGWVVFCEVIKVLKPKTCLFIGVESSEEIGMIIPKEGSTEPNHTGFVLKEVKEYDKISKTKPRSAIIQNIESKEETKIVFIQHTSQYFSWEKWHSYIKEQLGSQLDYFSKLISKN